MATREAKANVGEVLLAQMPADLCPNLQAAGSALACGFAYAGELEFGLELILDGL